MLLSLKEDFTEYKELLLISMLLSWRESFTIFNESFLVSAELQDGENIECSWLSKVGNGKLFSSVFFPGAVMLAGRGT
jgi:hypothetical protein